MTSRREALQARPRLAEKPDPVPLHIPGSNKPLSLRDEMRRYVREQISMAAHDNGAGTFEEENDFEEEDGDQDMLTSYSVLELVDENPSTSQLDGKPTPEDMDHQEPKEEPASLPVTSDPPVVAQANPTPV